MTAVSAAASAPAKKVDWATYEYTPCCNHAFSAKTKEQKIFCTCMELLLPTDRPLCTMHNGIGVFDGEWSEGKPFSEDEITARIVRVKQLIPQLATFNGYNNVLYRTGMHGSYVTLIGQVVCCVKNLNHCHELMGLIFKKVSFQPNRIVWSGNMNNTLLDELESRDPAFHAVVLAELRKLGKEKDREASLDYAALRKKQLAAAVTQKISVSASTAKK